MTPEQRLLTPENKQLYDCPIFFKSTLQDHGRCGVGSLSTFQKPLEHDGGWIGRNTPASVH
jgi:hypothetical protein